MEKSFYKALDNLIDSLSSDERLIEFKRLVNLANSKYKNLNELKNDEILFNELKNKLDEINSISSMINDIIKKELSI